MKTKLTKLIEEREKEFNKNVGGLVLEDKNCGDMFYRELAKFAKIEFHNRQTSIALIEKIIEMVGGIRDFEFAHEPSIENREHNPATNNHCVGCISERVYNQALSDIRQELQKTLKELKEDK